LWQLPGRSASTQGAGAAHPDHDLFFHIWVVVFFCAGWPVPGEFAGRTNWLRLRRGALHVLGAMKEGERALGAMRGQCGHGDRRALVTIVPSAAWVAQPEHGSLGSRCIIMKTPIIMMRQTESSIVTFGGLNNTALQEVRTKGHIQWH
jgi:hypothetical protein